MFYTEFLANYLGTLAMVLPNVMFMAKDYVPSKEAIDGQAFINGLKFLGAGMAGIGVIGAGVGQGNAGAGACMAIGRNPEAASKITSTMIISAGIAESGAIYALVIAMLLLFVAG